MKFIFIALLFTSLSSHAEILEVHSVAENSYRPGNWIVKLMDGRVGFWNGEEDSIINPRTLTRALIDADLSHERILTGIRIVGHFDEAPVKSNNGEKSFFTPQYVPTIYPSYNFATDVLGGMRRNWNNDSQCYDRSHVWSYEETFAGRYLQKAFLFFSDAYIGRYNYPWWFHTAPYALVRLNGEVVERVMDPAFTRYPLKFKLWTDMFMKNKVDCKLITKYSEYSTHPGEDDCYMMKTNIYFWQPKDLEALERSGVEKTKFIEWEIKHAYENAF